MWWMFEVGCDCVVFVCVVMMVWRWDVVFCFVLVDVVM